MNFQEFFKQATKSQGNTDGFSPYPYQIRLAESEEWPDVLSVPTGVGKTAAVILSWLYRRFEATDEIKKRTPRRLVYCLPMRTLVEQTIEVTERWIEHLELMKLVSTHLLMGGADAEDWDEYPERNAILIGTQDMLLSRALNRGYGMSRYRWPVDYALLNNDCQWVLDETQLMGTGLFTSAQLDLFGRIWPREKPCHFLWMSATIGSAFLDTTDRLEQKLQVGAPLVLEEDDLNDSRLRTRLNAEKQVEVLRSAPSAKRIVDEHEAGRITLVILNTVPAAKSMYEELMDRLQKDARYKDLPPELRLLHGRFRPSDRHLQIGKIKEFISQSDSETGAVPKSPGLIVVSTQVIEAGFDLSSVRLWSEIAPWASIVQRLGRLNREGKQPDACAFFWVPKAEPERENHKDSPNAQRTGPYEKHAIDLAKKLLNELVERQTGETSFRDAFNDVCKLPEAQDAIEVAVESVIRPTDFFELFNTEPDLAGGFTDISHFVRSADRNADVQVFWRELPASGPTLEHEGQPERNELCSVPVYEVQRLVGSRSSIAFEWNTETRTWESRRQWEIRPGMTLLVAQSAGGYTSTLGWTGNHRDRPTIEMRLSDEPESIEADLDSLGSDWVELPDHLADVLVEISEMVDMLQLDEAKATSLRIAALWHDWGKSLERWQSAALATTARVKENINSLLGDDAQSAFHELISGWITRFDPPRNSELLWAKFPDVRDLVQTTNLSREEKKELMTQLRAPFRPGHRHEAASALAAWDYWRSGKGKLTALAVYLIACHHGKVRTVMRRTSKNANVFGLTESDKLRPVANLSDKVHALEFDCCRFGASGSWSDDARRFEITSPSWMQMIDELLGPDSVQRKRAFEVIPETEPREIGPLALAYLESIICAADIRASKHPGKGSKLQ